MNYAKTIKDLRINRMNEKQSTFASNIEITQTRLSHIENGKKEPTGYELQDIADHVKIPYQVLFFMCYSETDISPEKREAFKILKPTIDEMIKTIF